FLALRGNRDDRLILARDANKLVASAVVKNPRISDQEVESISKIKWMHEEVLRTICRNRAWISNYTIMLNLVTNPRPAVNYSMHFIKRLQLRDLKTLSKSKGIPDVLRAMAARLTLQRQQGG